MKPREIFTTVERPPCNLPRRISNPFQRETKGLRCQTISRNDSLFNPVPCLAGHTNRYFFILPGYWKNTLDISSIIFWKHRFSSFEIECSSNENSLISGSRIKFKLWRFFKDRFKKIRKKIFILLLNFINFSFSLPPPSLNASLILRKNGGRSRERNCGIGFWKALKAVVREGGGLSFEWHFRLSAKLGVFGGRAGWKSRSATTSGLSHLNLNPWRARVNALVQWCAAGNLVVETGRKYEGNWHLRKVALSNRRTL